MYLANQCGRVLAHSLAVWVSASERWDSYFNFDYVPELMPLTLMLPLPPVGNERILSGFLSASYIYKLLNTLPQPMPPLLPDATHTQIELYTHTLPLTHTLKRISWSLFRAAFRPHTNKWPLSSIQMQRDAVKSMLLAFDWHVNAPNRHKNNNEMKYLKSLGT